MKLYKFSRAFIIYLCLFSFQGHAFELGVQTHIMRYRNDDLYYLGKINKYGFSSIRDEYPWAWLEKSKGKFQVTGGLVKLDDYFDRMPANNINGLLELVYSNKIYDNLGYPHDATSIEAYANYCYWMANRFKGKVKYYEIWNEWLYGIGVPNGKKITPPPEVYFQLVKAASISIRKADPNAIIVAGSLNPIIDRDVKWAKKLVDLGILDYINGISIHPYSFISSSYDLRSASGNLAAIDQFERNLQQITKRKIVDLYITEMGVPTYKGKGGVSQNEAASFVLQYNVLAKAKTYIKGVWWYDFIDDAKVSPNIEEFENHFGMIDSNGSPKISLQAISLSADFINNFVVIESKENKNYSSLSLKNIKKDPQYQYATIFFKKNLLNKMNVGQETSNTFIKVDILSQNDVQQGTNMNYLLSKFLNQDNSLTTVIYSSQPLY